MSHGRRGDLPGLTVLRLQVAGFTADLAVIGAVLAQADVVLCLAQAAVAFALAPCFFLIAQHAVEFFGHAAKL